MHKAWIPPIPPLHQRLARAIESFTKICFKASQRAKEAPTQRNDPGPPARVVLSSGDRTRTDDF